MQTETPETYFMRLAVNLAKNCPPVTGAFSVGAIIVDQSGKEISRGFSREIDATFHAEESAIFKAKQLGLSLTGCSIYSSLEPCGARLSGKTSCCQHIIESGIICVFYAWEEPSVFLEATGISQLAAAGVELVRLKGFEADVKAVNAHLF